MLAHLQDIRKNIKNCGLGMSINSLRKLCEDHHFTRMLPRIDSVAGDYDLMLRFFAVGFEDPQRVQLYTKLERSLYNIVVELIVEVTADRNPTFKQSRTNASRHPLDYGSIESTLLAFVQELTMASLETDVEERQRDLHRKLLRYRIAMFDSVYTSTLWTDDEAAAMERLLVSPMVETTDQLIILGAMLLAQLTVFDIRKFQTLCKVAVNGLTTEVRERALVAVALALPDKTDQFIHTDIVADIFGEMFESEGMAQKLVELQMQMILCLETANTGKAINEDILPTLARHSRSILDPQKSDDEMIDAMLHPEAEEKEMEEVEKAMERMRSMQKNGADIFFGGFSQTKRFAFFYTLMNWFCPFYVEHPQLPLATLTNIPQDFIRRMADAQQFCESDKFSFVLSLAHVINQLPKEMIELMKNGEVMPTFEPEAVGNETAFVRRLYLNDLYRFFCLYTDKNHFRSPFASIDAALFFDNELVEGFFYFTRLPLKLCRSLYRHKHYDSLWTMIEIYGDDDDMEYAKLRALCLEKQGDLEAAMDCYQRIMDSTTPPDSRVVLRMANISFDQELYEQAFEYYSRYKSLVGTDTDTEMEDFRIALCQMKLGLVEEGMLTLHRLSYNAPEEDAYYEAIAWGCMLSRNNQEAVEYYRKAGKLTAIGVLRKAIALWLSHDVAAAVDALREYSKLDTGNGEGVTEVMMSQMEELSLDYEDMIEAKILLDHALL